MEKKIQKCASSSTYAKLLIQLIIGIRDKPILFISSYLSNRTQSVRLGSTYSETLNVECGIPQGTLLGPILFILYLNNIFNINIKGKLTSFADDTVLFIQDKNWSVLKIKAEHDLQKLKEWFDYKRLTINFEKNVLCALLLL